MLITPWPRFADKVYIFKYRNNLLFNPIQKESGGRSNRLSRQKGVIHTGGISDGGSYLYDNNDSFEIFDIAESQS